MSSTFPSRPPCWTRSSPNFEPPSQRAKAEDPDIYALLALALIAQDPEGFVELAQDGRQLQWRGGWPNRINAIVPLAGHLRDDLNRRRAEAMRAAQVQAADARRRRYPFVAHVLSVDWQIQGITTQLISLSADTSVTQGGGHATDGYDALLWDRLRNRPFALTPMLDMPTLVSRFCAGHAAADRPSDEACPTLVGRPIVPADTDGNGRFDTLRVLMAVNYFEAHGYSIDVPIEASDIARLPDGYRPAFEAPGERRAPPAD